MKSLLKICIFWTDRAILATLSGRYAIDVYNAIYDRVSRYGAYKRVNITYFLDENHQTLQTYWKIMLCLFIELLIKSGSFCPKQCAISCANHRKNLKRNLMYIILSCSLSVCSDKSRYHLYFLSSRIHQVPWCSGYHIWLPHRRSPVRSRVTTYLFPSILPCGE